MEITNKLSKIILFFISMVMLCLNNSCSPYNKFWKYAKNDHLENKLLANHRSPMVKYPALTGGVVTGFIGLTLAFPYSILIGILGPDFQKMKPPPGEDALWNLTFFAPRNLLKPVGQTVVGAPCWTLFGWWWPEQNSAKPNLPKEKKNEQLPSGTVENGANPKRS